MARNSGEKTVEQRLVALEEEVQKVHREMAFRTRAFREVITEIARELDPSAAALVEERVTAILEEAVSLD